MSNIHLANDKIDIYAHANWEDVMTDFHISEDGLSENQANSGDQVLSNYIYLSIKIIETLF